MKINQNFDGHEKSKGQQMITKPQVGMCYEATHVSMKVPLIYAHKLAPVMTPHSHYNAIFQPKTRPTIEKQIEQPEGF